MRNAILLTLFFSTSLLAHSGRTNSEGCHNNRKTGDYHCHNSPKSSSLVNAGITDYSQKTCPVIGNTNSKIYHVPGGAFYGRMLVKNSGTDNRTCFNSTSEAESNGYRASKR